MSKKEKFNPIGMPMKTENGVITGFIPNSWQVGHGYNKCCLDPRNWLGIGEWRDDGCGEDCKLREFYPHCQCFSLLYGLYRDVSCSVCGTHQIATEYSQPRQAVKNE